MKNQPWFHSISRQCSQLRIFIFLGLISLLIRLIFFYDDDIGVSSKHRRRRAILKQCAALTEIPRPPRHFNTRTESDRFEEGTKPVLVRNATIWTGRKHGKEIINGDVLLARGLIEWIGEGDRLKHAVRKYGNDLQIVNANAAWVTPGIVDLHSHIGVSSLPALTGSNDGNSRHGITQPWLRSLDGLNTHDEAYKLSIAGGVTSANVLPGSANAIGGQAFPIKLRSTRERSSSSLLIEHPDSVNITGWRQLKQACGENPSRRYNNSRMDNIWSFRSAYNEARNLVQKQDSFCKDAKAGRWKSLKGKTLPMDLQWEALADVIRGKVKVHTHCYEAVDLDGLVRLSNEFEFPIAAFHHAHETYLVPDLLKKAWGGAPAAAIFAINARYKREAFRGSPFAPKVLADNNIRVVMKSDHPVLNSRYLLFEAQQAHYYGLPPHIALASITSTPADVLGLGHRIGSLKKGHDADLVIWDSHPLALSATPTQVLIDGIPQLPWQQSPTLKSTEQQDLPKVPNFDKETEETIKWEGLPPLGKDTRIVKKNVIFANVSVVWMRDAVTRSFTRLVASDSTSTIDPSVNLAPGTGLVVTDNGRITCFFSSSCTRSLNWDTYTVVDLAGGAIAPGLTSFGSPLGLAEINGEESTKDGSVFDPLASSAVPSILGGNPIRAIDGLQFETRNALMAYRSGVTRAITSPDGGFLKGYGVAFSTGSRHALEKGAIIQPTAGLHVTISHSNSASISAQIGTLRRLLGGHGGPHDELFNAFSLVADGSIPLLVHADSADVIASLIQLKQEAANDMHLTIVGGSEAHLLARELGEADVGVILVPVRPFPRTWEQRRIHAGSPLTQESAVGILLSHGITVGIGVVEAWEAMNARLDAGWIALECQQITKAEVLQLVTTNLDKLLSLDMIPADMDAVAFYGGDIFDFASKSIGVISSLRGDVELWIQ